MSEKGVRDVEDGMLGETSVHELSSSIAHAISLIFYLIHPHSDLIYSTAL